MNPRQQSWLMTALLVALAGAYVWFVFLPGKRALAHTEAELNDRRAYVANGHTLVLKIEQAEQRLAETRRYNQQWRPGAAGSAAAAASFGRIAQVLQQAGVTSTRFAPAAAVRFASLEEQPLHVSCVGTFAQVCRMLAGLEQLDQRCWIDELTIEQASEDGQTVKCDVFLAIFADNSGKSD